MAQFGWDKIDEYHDGYGYVPKEKAQWFRGPEWPDCPSTYEVERHEAKCDKCKKELYLDAAAAVYKCPVCETKDAEEGVYGRTDLGQGAIVDWHRAPFLKSDPSLLFSDLNIDVPWKTVWKSTSELGLMAWNLDAVEQTPLWRQHCVDGVGHQKFDFHTGGRISWTSWTSQPVQEN